MAHERHLNRWDYWILRVIAIYHILKALFFFALGVGLLHLVHSDIEQIVNDYVTDKLKFDSDSPYLKWLIDKLVDFTPHWRRIFSYLFIAYSIIFAIEGVGLYLRKRWAEYMVVIVVTSLLPFECYEIYERMAWWKIGIMVGNLLVVGFLVRQLVVGKPKHQE